MTKRFFKLMLIIISLFIILAISGSLFILWPSRNSNRDQWSQEIVNQCKGGFENCIVKADLATDFEWDEIYIFKNSATFSKVTDVLGFEYNNPKGSAKRKIIFLKDNKIIHEELNFYSNEGGLVGATFFEYESGDDRKPFFISAKRSDAYFKVNLMRNTDGSVYYVISLNH